MAEWSIATVSKTVALLRLVGSNPTPSAMGYTTISMIKQGFVSFARFFFARRSLFQLNLHLYKLSLRGLGVLNSDCESATGEPWFQIHIQSKLSPKIVVDVGANDEAYGHEVFKDAKIYAFEPHPASFKRLRLKSRGSVTPVWAAVGKRSGEATLWDFSNSAPRKAEQPTSQLASLHKNVIQDLYHQPAISYSVPLIALDDFAKAKKLSSIDLLKIDAEGHELEVLQGASQLITKGKIKVIQFEFNEMHAYSKVHMRDFYELLPHYEFFRLLPKELLPMGEYRPLTHELFGFQNIVCVHKSLRVTLSV